MNTFLGILLLVTSIFLILLILIQRGRGGGLAGAFGGMGGQSAFGTKAGDLFTRVTIGVTFFWILLCIVSVKVMGVSTNKFGAMGGSAPSDSGGAFPSAPGIPTPGPGNGADNGKSPDNVSPGTSPVAGQNGPSAAAGESPAASQDKTGGMVPPPGTAGDSGAAGAPIAPATSGANPSGGTQNNTPGDQGKK